MKNVFSPIGSHKITEANINYYASPFVHPRRKMREHDFIYLLSGKWKLGQNSEEFQLEKDSLLILSADETHYGITPCEKGTKTMYFHVSKGEGDKSGEFLEGIESHTMSANKNIKKLFFEVVNNKISGNQKKADLYFELLLLELSENRDSSLDVASKLKDIIHRNPEKFYSNEQLAEKVNVSVKTAENKFKAVFSETIHQYTIKFKIKEALSYFEIFPEIRIKEIALNLGFYDEYHFSKQFKKIMGVSPSEYRKRMS